LCGKNGLPGAVGDIGTNGTQGDVVSKVD
jgi:hypothetical protein